MKPSPEETERAMGAAFEITNARGAERLVALGRFAAWRGDLAAMRGDAGGSTAEQLETTGSTPAETESDGC